MKNNANKDLSIVVSAILFSVILSLIVISFNVPGKESSQYAQEKNIELEKINSSEIPEKDSPVVVSEEDKLPICNTEEILAIMKDSPSAFDSWFISSNSNNINGMLKNKQYIDLLMKGSDTDFDECRFDVVAVIQNLLKKELNDDGTFGHVEYIREGSFVVERYVLMYEVNIIENSVKEILNSSLDITDMKVFHFENSSYLVYSLVPGGYGGCMTDEDCKQLEGALSKICSKNEHGLWVYDFQTKKHTRIKPATFYGCE